MDKPPLTNEERIRMMAWLIHDLYTSRNLPYPEKPQSMAELLKARTKK